MRVSYNCLNTFFDGQLPTPDVVERALTFHAWEIEEVVEKDGDTMFDVKVLPDRSAWALSHRGIAKDLSVVLGIPLAFDPLKGRRELTPTDPHLKITVDTAGCDRYIAAHIKGVTIGPSPEWLVKHLATLGQRSINNVVDITNYVMLDSGQPLHAFDAQKIKGLHIGVRAARGGETIVSLTGESYTLSSADQLIVDGTTDAPIGIAGVKGGKAAEVDSHTTDLILEAAHFDRILVRKTSQRLKLRTDASTRYENGLVSDMTVYGVSDAVKLILEIAGGSLVGYVDTGTDAPPRPEVSLPLQRLNSVLGLSMSKEAVEEVIARFGYAHTWEESTLKVEPPFERTDLVIAEDLIEEIGRVYGYEHIRSVTPDPLPVKEINTTFQYVDRIRAALANAGFSEVFTSSFMEHDVVKLKNALASDKGYLRSSLTKNIDDVLARNAPNVGLLGVSAISVFEIGAVFTEEGEQLSVALGVRTGSGYKAKPDDAMLASGIEAVEKVLGVSLSWSRAGGIGEAVLSSVIKDLPVPVAYAPFTKIPDITYRPFSTYPFALRDIALWVPGSVQKETVEEMIKNTAGELLVRIDNFDVFEKEGRTSYAFHLVFQSYERTLSEIELNEVMAMVVSKLESNEGWKVR